MRTRYSTNFSKIVGTAYGFNTAFPTWPSSNMSALKCSEHIRLCFTRTNLAGPPSFIFLTHMLHNSGFFTESGKLEHSKYSCYYMNTVVLNSIIQMHYKPKSYVHIENNELCKQRKNLEQQETKIINYQKS